MNNIVIIVLIAILIICLSQDILTQESFEQKSNKTWKTGTFRYQVQQIYSNVLAKYGVFRTYGSTWSVYIPCSYNNIGSELDQLVTSNKDQLIFALRYADDLVSKSTLWLHLVKYYKTRDAAKRYAPLTYVLYKPQDLILFQKEYDPNKLYILKKNIQRQEGIKITNTKVDILSGYLSGYVVAQELLQRPYLVNDRKINLRMYVLIICRDNNLNAYVHDDGFMYYTKSQYVSNSNKFSENITTGYIDRWIYDINPLTHSDFRKYLDINRQLNVHEKSIVNNGHKLSKYVFDKINELLINVLNALREPLLKKNKLSENVSFQLFGADVAISDDLNAYIMEFNKGPSLDCKDDRDCQIKNKVVTDMFSLLKLINSDSQNLFVQLI